MTSDVAVDADPLPAIAAYGLRGSRLDLPADPPTDDTFDGLLSRLRNHRLLGLAASAAAAGDLRLTDTQRDQLHAAHADAMCLCLHLEATLLDVNQSLQEAGVAVRVLKGPASAHLDYHKPELRHFGDLDLLVRSDEMERAKAVLHSLGFTRPCPEPRRGFDRRFGKGATFIGRDGTNVDLHRTFVMGPLGLRVGLEQIWTEGETFRLGGETVHSLGPVHRLLAACYNAVVGDAQPRLATLRDIAQLSLRHDLSGSDIIDTAVEWGADLVLARGVTRAWLSLRLTDVIALSAWAARHEGDADDHRLLRLYHDRQAGYAGLSWATARMLPLRQRATFLAALAFPSGGRLGKRRWRLVERVRRAARGYSRPAA